MFRIIFKPNKVNFSFIIILSHLISAIVRLHGTFVVYQVLINLKRRAFQERALIIINNDNTSPSVLLLKSTNTQPLHVRRLKQMACEVFKIANNMSLII